MAIWRLAFCCPSVPLTQWAVCARTGNCPVAITPPDEGVPSELSARSALVVPASPRFFCRMRVGGARGGLSVAVSRCHHLLRLPRDNFSSLLASNTLSPASGRHVSTSAKRTGTVSELQSKSSSSCFSTRSSAFSTFRRRHTDELKFLDDQREAAALLDAAPLDTTPVLLIYKRSVRLERSHTRTDTLPRVISDYRHSDLPPAARRLLVIHRYSLSATSCSLDLSKQLFGAQRSARPHTRPPQAGLASPCPHFPTGAFIAHFNVSQAATEHPHLSSLTGAPPDTLSTLP